jgi:two-component system response regulator MprA
MSETRTGVLVVDDDPNIRACVSDLLSYEGYRVETAVDGRQALAVLESWRPGVIMLDLMMAHVNGWDFLAKQRTDPELSQIPVIVMSASHHLGTASQPTVAAMLAKPFEIDTVLTQVAALTIRPRHADAVDNPAG